MTPETLHPGFLDVPLEHRGYKGARVVVLPLPYDATCSYGVGTRFGPARIIEAIEACHGNFTRAASYLGISRMTLYRSARKHDIPTPQGG